MIKAAGAKTPSYSVSLNNLTVIEVSIFTQHLSFSLLSPCCCCKRQRSNNAWAFLVSAYFDARRRPHDRGNVMVGSPVVPRKPRDRLEKVHKEKGTKAGKR